MSDDDVRLMRMLTGELPEEERRALAAELLRDPALARRHDALRRVWEGLEVPPPPAVPPGFATRVTARATAEAANPFALAPAPTWVRGAAVAALLAGVALGGGVGWLSLGAAASGDGDEVESVLAGETFAESWFAALAAGASEERR